MFFPPRHFNLRMKRDTTLFAQDLKVDVSGEEVPYDTSHIYTGEIYGTTDLGTQESDSLDLSLRCKTSMRWSSSTVLVCSFSH